MTRRLARTLVPTAILPMLLGGCEQPIEGSWAVSVLPTVIDTCAVSDAAYETMGLMERLAKPDFRLTVGGHPWECAVHGWEFSCSADVPNSQTGYFDPVFAFTDELEGSLEDPRALTAMWNLRVDCLEGCPRGVYQDLAFPCVVVRGLTAELDEEGVESGTE